MLLKEERKRWYILIATLYIAYVFTMHKWGHQGDMLFWLNWSKYIFEHGFTHVYDNKECNYLPAYLYVLWGHVKLQGNTVDIGDNLYTIKFFTLIFDVAAAVLSVRFVKELKDKTYYFLLLMFNVAYIYNTVFWGQVDAIFTFWGFAALLLAIEQRVEWSILCLTIALNFKLQALVFIPVVGALLLPNFLTLKGMKKFLLAIIISFFIQIIILLPFILSGRLGQVWHVIIDSVGHYPFPTVGAFNLWTILLPNVSIEGMYKISDETKIGFLSYKQIGQFLFISTVLVSLYPLVNYLVKKYLKKNYSVFPIKNVFLIAALTSLNFYFFNTEMHERYSHPALVCLAAYAFLSKRFLPLILGSIAYFLNMERICWYLNLHNDTYENGFLFKPRLIAGLYLILILLLYFLLYKKEKVKVKEEEAVLN
jgi:Gpi18-like mannosyltransferase